MLRQLKKTIQLMQFPLMSLLIWLVLAGSISLLLGKELNWDLANYHFYNPYAFFYNRWQIDYWPPDFIHGTLNPAVDFITYFLIQYCASWCVVFLLGMLHGVNFWLIFLISLFYVPLKFATWLRLSIVGFLTWISIFGPSVIQGIGSFQHDMTVSLFVLGFVYLQLSVWQKFQIDKIIDKKLFGFSAFLLGIGVGLKYTAAVFFLGAAFTLISFPISIKKKIGVLINYCVFFMLGMAISSGFWMMFLWQKYGNPFFPYFNDIFHSANFAQINWRDLRFLPQDLWHAIFFPFYFSWDGQLVADTFFRDFRFAIIYLLFILLFVRLLFLKLNKTTLQVNLLVWWLLAFFLFSYIVWQEYFAIFRYLVTLELLAPLIIFVLVMLIFKNSLRRIVTLLAIYCVLLVGLIPMPHAVRAPWYHNDYFNVRLPAFVYDQTKKNPTVLISFAAYLSSTYPRPHAYLIPFFPKNWTFFGVPFIKEKAYFSSDAINKLKKIDGPFYVLTSEDYLNEFYRVLTVFNLKGVGNCARIHSDRQIISNEDVLLCPLEKVVNKNSSTL